MYRGEINKTELLDEINSVWGNANLGDIDQIGETDDRIRKL